MLGGPQPIYSCHHKKVFRIGKVVGTAAAPIMSPRVRAEGSVRHLKELSDEPGGHAFDIHLPHAAQFVRHLTVRGAHGTGALCRTGSEAPILRAFRSRLHPYQCDIKTSKMRVLTRHAHAASIEMGTGKARYSCPRAHPRPTFQPTREEYGHKHLTLQELCAAPAHTDTSAGKERPPLCPPTHSQCARMLRRLDVLDAYTPPSLFMLLSLSVKKYKNFIVLRDPLSRVWRFQGPHFSCPLTVRPHDSSSP